MDIDRLRIAEVNRGTLVRDASVDGRVVVAVSPTLHSPVASNVVFGKQAGARPRHEAVLANALRPFYSTKRNGAGWGPRWCARSPRGTAGAFRPPSARAGLCSLDRPIRALGPVTSSGAMVAMETPKRAPSIVVSR